MRSLAAAVVAVISISAWVGETAAQTAPNVGAAANRPILITADELRHDRDGRRVIARGNVEISQGDRIILADQVIYNQQTKRVVATGNVSMIEPSGETIFGDRIELDDDLKDGVIQNFRMLFPDESKVAANGARRTGGRRTEMAKVVYSPCKVCEDDPKRAPLWQIKARKVVHHQDTRDIEYFDAWLEVFGQPVVYTPYLSHPDPTVKRRSGFLVPTWGNTSYLGYFSAMPYFWAIGDDKDVTITPLVTTKNRAALFLEYRQRFKKGSVILSGSFTRVSRTDALGDKVDGDENRGHLFGKLRYDINKNWRTGFDGYWASDDTFLRVYEVSDVQTLTSTAWLEGFHGRNYTSARAYHFQGMRVEDHYRRDPIVAPFLEHFGFGKPHQRFGRLHYAASLVSLGRFQGVDTRRVAANVGWRLPYTHPSGFIVTVTADLHAQGYWIQGLFRTGADKFSGLIGRIYPQVNIDWRYPFVRELGNVRQVVEPRVALILQPSGLNVGKIPNEDSVDFELDDANLFASNRYPGLDRVDDGIRLVYGVSTALLANRGGETSIFVGQSLRMTGERGFGDGSGLEDDLSDIVGRIRVNPADYFSLTYRFRFDVRKFEARRNEVSFRAGVPALNVSVGYFYYAANSELPEFGERQQLALGVRSQISKYWSVKGSALWDLDGDGILNWNIGGQFQNECCTISAVLARSFTRDRDLRRNTSFIVRIVLKNLGEIGAGR